MMCPDCCNVLFVNNILLEFGCVFYASVILLGQWEDSFGYTCPPNSHSYIIVLFYYVAIICTRFLLGLFLLLCEFGK